MIALFLIGLLLLLVFQPFGHPRVHFVFAEIQSPQLPGIPRVPTSGNRDSLLLPKDAFRGAPSAESPIHEYQIASSSDLEHLMTRLAGDGDIRREDVLILWLAAQPVSTKDDILLLGATGQLDSPFLSYFSLSAILDRLRDCPARTKLILFDNGRVLHAPRLGIFADGSAHRIKQLVRSIGDPTLWFVLSHSELEQSQTQEKPLASAFAIAVGQGLQGQADLNQDRFIDLGEFFQYVGDRLKSTTAGRPTRISQTPVLLWGCDQAKSRPDYPVLAPVVPRRLAEDEQAGGQAALSRVVPGGLASDASPRLHISRGAGLASRPSVHVSGPRAPRTPHVPTTYTTPSVSSLGNSLDSATEPLPDTATTPGDTQSPDASGEPDLPEPEPATSTEWPIEVVLTTEVENLPLMAWSRFDQIAATQGHLIDRAPHLWRALDSRLLLLDASSLRDAGPNVAAGMRFLIRQLDDLANGRMPQQLDDHDLVVQLARLLYTSDGIPPEGSLALFEQMTGQHEVAPLDQWIAAGSRDEFEALIKESPSPTDGSARYTEVLLARRLAACVHLEWSEIRLALEVCRRGEQVAAETLESGPWVRPIIEHADQLRLSAERDLLTTVRPEDRVRADVLLRQALAEYNRAAEGNADVLATQRLLNEGLFYVPSLFEWSVSSLRSAHPATPGPERISELLQALRQAVELLDHPTRARLLELRRTRYRLQQAVKIVRAGDFRSNVPVIEEEKATQFNRLRDLASLYAEWVHLLVGEGSRAQAIGEAAERLCGTNDPDEFWDACDQLGDATRSFYESLPDIITQQVAANSDLNVPHDVRDARIRELRKTRRMLYAIQPWDVHLVASANPTPDLRRAQLYDMFRWQRERLTRALIDAPAKERSTLITMAQSAENAAESIPGQPPLAAIQPSFVDLEVVQLESLVDMPEAELRLMLTSRHDRPVDAWLFSDYDSRRFSVQAGDDVPIYDWPRPVPTVTPSHPASPPDDQVTLARRTLVELPPTVNLPPGHGRMVSLRLGRKGLSPTDGHIVFRMVTSNDNARGDLTVELPHHAGVALAVSGQPGTWQPAESGLILCPFPNRTTSYRLSLINTEEQATEVDFQLLRTASEQPVSLPNGQIRAELVTQCLERLQASQPVLSQKNLTIPANGQPVAIPFGAPPPKTPNDQPQDGEAEEPEAKTVVQPAPPPAKSPKLSRHLVAVITERTTQRAVLRSIEILTQRPRRYVIPLVQFDPSSRRVAVRVRPVSGTALPPDGVQITCESAGMHGDTQCRQTTVLQPNATEAVLHLDVPVQAGPMLPVEVHVDGFQRAFRYQVPLDSRWPVDVPESSRIDLRILTPRSETVFGPQEGEIDVAMEVDVPGGLREGNGFLEVGIDTDRDRELRGERTWRLSSDRQVDLHLDHFAPDGTLAIRTRVDDVRTSLTVPKLSAARVNLMARVSLPDRETWSDPVELVLDSQAPGLSNVHLLPGRNVHQGSELEVSALASDWRLSGIAKVEVGFDLLRQGEFGEDVPPVEAVPLDNGRWAAKLPTAEIRPGHYAVLIRATDRQENKSDYLRVFVQVLPKDESMDDSLRTISGTVVYGRYGKSPVEKVTVRLIDKAEETVAQAVSDAEGRFTLRVPPGDYQLVAEALIKGNRRAARINVTAPAEDTSAEEIELLLTTDWIEEESS